ncbi:hypothetical protein OPT61_g9761 [Boeremia exigua]|uniref:Uncharacterized protein n=1 Tax=Boeremia exigua TaxID=749465 RepID=A0ACC2HT09_9PLEO|nr:hypothetical protein OPT61_g9761 [Boeremia exigua]
MAPPRVINLSSPSIDTEAASQQLLAEASSPVRRSPSATASASAVLGATLLNHARALTKPSAAASAAKPGKLPRPGKLKPLQLQKPGKLAPAGLSGLVADGPPNRLRGEKMYDIELSPQKKRPASSPSRTGSSDDGTSDDGDVVLETSQVQPDNEGIVDVVVTEEATDTRGISVEDDQPNHVAAEPVVITGESPRPIPPKRGRGRPRKSGASTASLPPTEVCTVEALDAAAVEPEAAVEPDVPSSPPVLSTNEGSATAATKQPEGPSQSGDGTVSSPVLASPKADQKEKAAPRFLSPKIKRKAREHSVTKGEPHAPPAKKLRRLNGPKMISPDMPELKETLKPYKPVVMHNAHLPAHPQPEVRIPIRATRSDTARRDAGAANAQEHSATAIVTAAGLNPNPGRRSMGSRRPARTAKTAKTVPVGPPKRKAPPRAQRARIDDTSAEEADGSAEEVEQAGDDQEEMLEEKAAEQNRAVDAEETSADDEADDEPGEGARDASSGSEYVDNTHEAAEENDDQGQDDDQDQNDDANAGDAAPAATEERTNTVRRHPTLDRLFNSLDTEGRSGVCTTTKGRNIHRRCDRSRFVLSRPGEECSLEDITRCKDELVSILRTVVEIPNDSRPTFKRDAFAFLFRSLTLVLEAMHDKLHEMEGEVTESLLAMQILYPFVREMLLFKETMNPWKVAVRQVIKGERLIRTVETGLIAPLRVVEQDFRRALNQLRAAGRRRVAIIEMHRQREEEERDLDRKEEALRSVRERRKHWQDLHIVRMQCESDPSRRRRLRLIDPIQVSETDANGQPFERVPFFGKRSAPPPQLSAAASGREWTTEQETALLDALQQCDCKFVVSATAASIPLTLFVAALEHIFKTRCTANRPLRDFSVSDFAVKLAWIRSGWAQLSHQHGWEIPEWVNRIPILPIKAFSNRFAVLLDAPTSPTMAFGEIEVPLPSCRQSWADNKQSKQVVDAEEAQSPPSSTTSSNCSTDASASSLTMSFGEIEVPIPPRRQSWAGDKQAVDDKQVVDAKEAQSSPSTTTSPTHSAIPTEVSVSSPTTSVNDPLTPPTRKRSWAGEMQEEVDAEEAARARVVEKEVKVLAAQRRGGDQGWRDSGGFRDSEG